MSVPESCPYCGHTPYVHILYKATDAKPKRNGYRIKCRSKKCNVNPSIDIMLGDGEYRQAKAKAIFIWNGLFPISYRNDRCFYYRKIEKENYKEGDISL